MCVNHRRSHNRIVYWTVMLVLVVTTGVAITGVIQGFKLRDRYNRYGTFLTINYNIYTLAIVACCAAMCAIAIFTAISITLQWYPTMIISAYCLLGASFVIPVVGIWFMAVTKDLTSGFGLTVKSIKDMESLLKGDTLPFNNTLLDFLHMDMKCCGVHTYMDFRETLAKRNMWMKSLLPIPQSCCVDPGHWCEPDSDAHHHEGCLNRLVAYTSEQYNTFASTFVVFGAMLGISAFYVFILSKKAKETYLFYPYYF